MSLSSPSTIPPPPSNNLTSRTGKLYTSSIKKIDLTECIWASKYPEVQKACYLARICTTDPPKCCRYRNVPSILQSGPTCGLTALSMLLDNKPSPDELLIMAKDRSYTCIGEMFSARNFYQLVVDVAMQKDPKIQCQFYEGRLNCAKVKDYLRKGACLFVPYDPDFNHGPCLKMGHKAHWAIIIGYLIDKEDEFYVLSRHGKSKNIAVWPLKALSLSNSNLIEFAQPKGYPDTKFLVPEGGIGGDLGLRNRSIIVNGISTNEIIVA